MKKLVLAVTATTILALSTTVHAQSLTSNVIGGGNPPPSTFGNVKTVSTGSEGYRTTTTTATSSLGVMLVVLFSVFRNQL